MDTLQAAQSHLLVHSSKIHAGDLICGLTSEATDLKREQAEVERLEMWPPVAEPGSLGAPDLLHTKDCDSNLQVSVGQLMCNLWKELLLIIFWFLF